MTGMIDRRDSGLMENDVHVTIAADDRSVLLNSIDMVISHIDEVTLKISYLLEEQSGEKVHQGYPLIAAVILFDLMLDHVDFILGLRTQRPARPEALGHSGVGLSDAHADRFAQVLEPALDSIFPAPDGERIGPAWARAWRAAMRVLPAPSRMRC